MNKELIKFIKKSPSPFHAIKTISKELDNNGFEALKENETWNLKEDHKYYVTRNGSSIIAFSIPKEFDSFNIISSHSDSPTFKIKDNSEITVENYVKLNTEPYGGMIMSSWFDRPLSVAGRIIVKQKDHYESKLVNIDKDLLIIPNVAIHMNRDINSGYKYNAQSDTLPLFSLNNKDKLLDTIAKYLNIDSSAILGHDLFLYNRTSGTIWGNNNEFISSPKLDDLQCAFCSLKAFLNSDHKLGTMLCVFDNEEVGSLTKQGADSTLLEDTIKRINESLGGNYENYLKIVANSFMLSADNAHAVHPNHPELADPVNRPVVNGGVVIKYHGGQKYTSDAISGAVFKDICNSINTPVQVFTNRSDKVGGSTLGNLSNAHVSLNSVDIGLAQLAMHSSYETAGCNDTNYLVLAMQAFYNHKIMNIK